MRWNVLRRRLQVVVPIVLCAGMVAPAAASASLAPGLCHVDTSRGSIPKSFAVRACFDGHTLYIYNDLDVALGVAVTGSVGTPTRIKTDYDLAAVATRKVSKDPDLLLPGDELRFPIGSGSARVKLRGTPKIGYYAEARAFETYIPGKTFGVVQAFTAMTKEVDQDGRQYADCAKSKRRLQRLTCQPLLVRNIGFAGSRFVVHGGLSVAKHVLGKVLSVLVGTVELMKWAYYQPQQVRQIVYSGTISLRASPSAGPPPPAIPPAFGTGGTRTSAPFDECPAIGADTGCSVLIIVASDGHKDLLTDPAQGAYDGTDDTSVGVLNESASAVSSIALTGSDIFDFDGDGLCTDDNAPSACPFGSTGYEGPGTVLSADDGTFDSGTVLFPGGLPPGGSTYFSLEGPVTSLVAQPPAVTTANPTDIAADGATVNGTIDPNGADTTYYVDYGTDTSYGWSSDSATITASPSESPGGDAQAIQVPISGLDPGTTYHYRIVASNLKGTVYGPDETFTTAGQ